MKEESILNENFLKIFFYGFVFTTVGKVLTVCLDPIAAVP